MEPTATPRGTSSPVADVTPHAHTDPVRCAQAGPVSFVCVSPTLIGHCCGTRALTFSSGDTAAALRSTAGAFMLARQQGSHASCTVRHEGSGAGWWADRRERRPSGRTSELSMLAASGGAISAICCSSASRGWLGSGAPTAPRPSCEGQSPEGAAVRRRVGGVRHPRGLLLPPHPPTAVQVRGGARGLRRRGLLRSVHIRGWGYAGGECVVTGCRVALQT